MRMSSESRILPQFMVNLLKMSAFYGSQFRHATCRALKCIVVLSCLLFVTNQAHAACPSLDALNDALKSAQGVSTTDKDALLDAHSSLSSELSSVGKVLPECQRKSRILAANARKELKRLQKLIAELEKKENEVVLNIARSFEGDAKDEEISVFLNGKPVQGTRATPGRGRHEITVQYAASTRRVLTLTFKLNGAELSPYEKTETSSTFIVSAEESGSYDIALIVKGEAIPDPMALEITLSPKDSPVSFTLDDVPINPDKPIRLDETREEQRLVVSHPDIETDDGWFRLGAKLNDAKFKAKSEEPTETIYMLRGQPGKTLRFKLRTAAGPKENPARPYVILIGAGLIVAGGGYGIIKYLDVWEIEDKALEKYEDSHCDEPARGECGLDVQEDINDLYEEADDERVWANAGFIVAGVGVLTAAVGLFVLESGKTPPRLSNDELRRAQFANARDNILQNVRLVPQMGPQVVGAHVSGTW